MRTFGDIDLDQNSKAFGLLNAHDWNWLIQKINIMSKFLLTVAMAAIGLSTNLKELKNMGYKPFIVGFIGMATVGLVSITTIELYLNFFN